MRLRYLAAGLLGCAAACGAPDAPKVETKPAAAGVTPGLEDVDGKPFALLGADARPDVVLFVRHDCPISNRYAPTYQRMAKAFADQGVDVWRVYVDADESAAVIAAHEAEYQLPGKALRDPTQAFARGLGISVTPEAALFDASGERIYRGRIDDWYADYGKPRAAPTTHELEDAVTALVEGRTPPSAVTEAVGCPLPPPPGQVASKTVESPTLPGADGKVPEQVTFTEHVAPLIHARCASCHRDGQVAPFALIDEGDIRDHAEQIVDVTRSRYMPPWKPVAGHGEFADDRSLTEAQIELLARWVEQGQPTGPEQARPEPPTFPEGWARGTPDLILELDGNYEVPADGLDIYRNFVLPSTVDAPRWIAGWELDPGNPRVVHHAILNLANGDWAAKQDAKDPGPGFDAMELQGIQSPGGSYLVWTPGLIASETENPNAWQLRPDSTLILQLHLQPTGKPEGVSPRVGLFFGERPTATGVTLRVGDVPIDIAPGERDYEITDSVTLPSDAELLSVFPHAHYLATHFESKATLPDGRTLPLLRIDDWDFSWQDQYRYREPITLPAGTVVDMRIRYDNSADNPRNPSQPPRRVVLGPNSTDEMGNLTFELVAKDRESYMGLREMKYRRAIDRGAGYTQHYNLANVLRDRGNFPEAIHHYQKVLSQKPDHVWTLHNLSMLFSRVGRHREAVELAQRECEVTPQAPAAFNNLGNALKGAQKRDEAIAAFRRALELDPQFALARNGLLAMGVQP